MMLLIITILGTVAVVVALLVTAFIFFQKIVDGRIGIRDEDIKNSLKLLERRLKSRGVLVESSSWTGRPSGGSF
jgi:hypothetical protein